MKTDIIVIILILLSTFVAVRDGARIASRASRTQSTRILRKPTGRD